MSKLRSWFPFIVLAGAAVSFVLGSQKADVDLTAASNHYLLTGAVAVLLLAIWWLAFSRAPMKRRLVVFVGATAVLAAATQLFRFEGTTGGNMPILVWRFADDPSERIAAPTTTERAASEEMAEAKLVATSEDWVAFRGPNRDGIARGETVRVDWNETTPRLVWRKPVGPAWSSFTIVGDWLFTQEQREGAECVVAYDAATGAERWVHSDATRYDTFMGGAGPRATPTFDGGTLFTVGALGRVNALAANTGEVVWTRDMAADAGTKPIEWAYACSPLVVGDLVIVNPGKNGAIEEGGDAPDAALIAYDRGTGEIRWSAGARPGGYAAPRLESIGGEPHVLAFGVEGLGGHALDTGAEQWFFPWTNQFKNGAAQPLVKDGRILVSVFSTGAAQIEPKRDEAGAWTVDTAWKQRRFQMKFNGMVERDGLVFGLDGGILAGLDWATGERLWKEGRYEFGQLVLADNALIAVSEWGEVHVLEVGRDEPVVKLSFEAIDGKCWNHPVLNRGRLYVRSDLEMACYEVQ